MPLLILLILLSVPYLEFLVFMEVGNSIGGFQALLLTILTAVLGVYLIRQQGLVVMARMHESLQKGQSPVTEILHGFFLLIAGLFFLLPGFITDSIALALAIQPIRSILGAMIVKNIGANFYRHPTDPNSQKPDGVIIDGEFEEDHSPNTPLDSPFNHDDKREK